MTRLAAAGVGDLRPERVRPGIGRPETGRRGSLAVPRGGGVRGAARPPSAMQIPRQRVQCIRRQRLPAGRVAGGGRAAARIRQSHALPVLPLFSTCATHCRSLWRSLSRSGRRLNGPMARRTSPTSQPAGTTTRGSSSCSARSSPATARRSWRWRCGAFARAGRCAHEPDAADHDQRLKRMCKGSYPLRCTRHGYGYLKAVRVVFGTAINSAAASTP